MKLQGKLDFNMNGEYAIYTGESYIPISSLLNSMLGDNIKIKILDKKDNEIFKEQGVILKEKLITNGYNKSNLYIYKINGQDLDSILWENVDKKITFIIHNQDENKATEGDDMK